nr:hypothetical protein PTVJELPE_PTVJELPE_CDS_0007 [Cressdnaviricota sp.]
MARRRDKRHDSSPSLRPELRHRTTDARSLLDRSRFLARRSVRESLLSPRAFRNLAVEDLRREKRFLSENLPTQTYRRETGSPASVVGREVHTDKMRKQGMPSRLRYEFEDPKRTLVCIRRKARRAVIFAMRRAGKGGRKNRKARWTEKSYVTCRKGR